MKESRTIHVNVQGEDEFIRRARESRYLNREEVTGELAVYYDIAFLLMLCLALRL